MKKLSAVCVLAFAFVLTSCDMPTDKEISEQRKICEINEQKIFINEYGKMFCVSKTKTMNCIREYNQAVYNKYNNPDTVSDLREDDFSKVVKTCNEVFGSGSNQ